VAEAECFLIRLKLAVMQAVGYERRCEVSCVLGIAAEASALYVQCEDATAAAAGEVVVIISLDRGGAEGCDV
jgi:hypothetical protein